MERITSLIKYDREFSSSVSAILSQYRSDAPLPIIINGLAKGASDAYICEAAYEICEKTSAPVLILAATDAEMERVCGILSDAGLNARSYLGRELVFYNISASHDSERERISLLLSLLSGDVEVIVTTPAALVSPTVPPDMLLGMSADLKVGTNISPQELSLKLDNLGYAVCDLVESTGQFARRGGIVDFYQNADEDPIRVEFFGDEIDRMVYFDPITQRASAPCSEVKLSPAVEVMLSSSAKDKVLSEIKSLISKTDSENTVATLKREAAAIEGGALLDCRDKYINLIYGKIYTLMDYLRSAGKCTAFILGTNECDEALKRAITVAGDNGAALTSRGLISEKYAKFSASADEYRKYLSSVSAVHINSFAGAGGISEAGGLFGFRTRRTVSYGGNPKMLDEDIKSLYSGGYRIIIQSENMHGSEALREKFFDEGYTVFAAQSASSIELPSGASIVLTQGRFDGFDLIMPKIALLSMAEDEGRRIMARRRQQRILKKSGGAGQKIMSYADLEVGDYVVHANYGIGLFEGMQSVRIDGVTKDYITIRYAGTDKLFVPCERLELIGKYIGAREDDGTVKLSKMGGADWHRAKSKAKAAVKDMADKLIKLYAKRQRTEGFAFPADSELEDEFAAGFEYSETESQLAAIADIKADMMKPVPMNRLLCGDVGFGKTEVALRAAFKAIMGGKQVALLVPTTILALQHYQTALSRMRGYPVTVEMLSRFKTPKEQTRIKESVKEGKTDILIGTHKLLGKSIEFKDLGLLIVDEEQRFGVAQKEKLKETSANIDVLTLSATPIPRTLNMAISGISDMSVLDEAPENRRPVQTYVLEHDDLLINEAIRAEIRRGGQVLYLYNNIETIDYVADKISKEIPEARVAYAHGRMEKDELEDVWQMLVDSELDVLVCTTIIETGVDLPMANTLIIENSDRMGLSQLHQIRGRVGRSERQAYAYFTYRPGKALTDIAKKRLSAIRQYAEFGAGFKVALCDLEIRGAGNILGAEQHGYIDSVGYDLYIKLLNEAVIEEMGNGKQGDGEIFEAVIDIKADAHIPEYYITKSAHRMEIYKKISHIRKPLDMEDIYDELIDRFGDVPKPTERLLRVALCRAVCERARISKVSIKGTNLLFFMDSVDLSIWAGVLQKYRGKLIGMSGKAPIVYKLTSGEDAIKALTAVLSDYYTEMNSV